MRDSNSLSRSASPLPAAAHGGPYPASSSSTSTRAACFSDENPRGTPNTIPTSPPSTARQPKLASGLHWSVSPETPRSKARCELSPSKLSWATVSGSRSSPRKPAAIKTSAPLVIASDTEDDEPPAFRSSLASKGKGRAKPTLGDLFIDDDPSSDYDPEADNQSKRHGGKVLCLPSPSPSRRTPTRKMSWTVMMGSKWTRTTRIMMRHSMTSTSAILTRSIRPPGQLWAPVRNPDLRTRLMMRTTAMTYSLPFPNSHPPPLLE